MLQARASLKDQIFDTYLDYYGIDIKAAELDDLEKLFNKMKVSEASGGDLGDFYVGYKIPQIGKEFDLLRFGKTSIVNIELKRESSTQKIKAQLLRNSYYLSFIGRTVYAFSFVSSSGTLYFLGNDRELETVDAAHLLEVLAKQGAGSETAPDLLFNPSDYLVSPFNSTGKFLSGEYFLTHQQEQFKSGILSSIATKTGAKFVGITGSAGTGKTLLTYDIAKHLYAENKKILIIHCGQLNRGHHHLAREGWQISAIRDYHKHDLNTVDLLIIDEAQRIKQSQLDDILKTVTPAKCTCIFSYDKVQTLSNSETARDMAGKIGAISSISTYRLSEKIRSNKEIANFIKMLFSRKASTQIQPGPNIRISYFDNSEDAKTYLTRLDSAKWEVLRFTPSQYANEHHEKYFDSLSKTAHQVIGQEFDGVAIAMDKFFAYDAAGDLTYRGGAYYDPTRMLFQNITRARRRLDLVIIDNEVILQRCLAILK
jgi:hypothetical protein